MRINGDIPLPQRDILPTRPRTGGAAPLHAADPRLILTTGGQHDG